MRYSVRCAAVGMVVIGTACIAASPDSTSDAPSRTSPSAFLGDVESYVMTSHISGRDYSISVALPYGYADSAKTYPILYALDANGQFGTVVETARLLRYEEFPQLIMVGIGYPYGGRQINAEPHRIVDLFSVLDHDWIEEMRDTWLDPVPDFDEGGAPSFLRFIVEELIPSIESNYDVIPNDRAIYGHSAGGWFGLYALLEGQGVFQRAIVGSPSLWWSDAIMFDLEEAYAEDHTALPARVFFSIGAEESNSFFAGSCLCMTRNFARLVDVLESRQYTALEWTAHVFEDETHNSVVPATISRGLRYIYGQPF